MSDDNVVPLGAAQRQRADRLAYPGFTDDCEGLTDAGLLEFTGDGVDRRHITPEGVRAIAILLSFTGDALPSLAERYGGAVARAEAERAIELVGGLTQMIGGVDA